MAKGYFIELTVSLTRLHHKKPLNTLRLFA